MATVLKYNGKFITVVFHEGDTVKSPKYGIGEITSIVLDEKHVPRYAGVNQLSTYISLNVNFNGKEIPISYAAAMRKGNAVLELIAVKGGKAKPTTPHTQKPKPGTQPKAEAATPKVQKTVQQADAQPVQKEPAKPVQPITVQPVKPITQKTVDQPTISKLENPMEEPKIQEPTVTTVAQPTETSSSQKLQPEVQANDTVPEAKQEKAAEKASRNINLTYVNTILLVAILIALIALIFKD